MPHLVSEPLSKGLIMKCSNCPSDAQFLIADPGVSDVFYCMSCLPQSLRGRADAGQLDFPKVEEPTQTKKKAAAPKAPEPAPASEPEPEAPDATPEA
jgi:hypothetical protein